MQSPTRIIPVVALLLVAGSAVAAENGTQFNNHCRTCHSAKADDNRQGPSLHGIVGARAGSSQGFANYSQAMKNSGITWDEATLEKFIANPEAVEPNNNMKPFGGVDDPAVRRQIVEFLKSQG
ncbi:MAG TPA: c-type cytochrome [Povalibacter sp.]|nr:c-type cytochrome [Povalibacter sp.]